MAHDNHLIHPRGPPIHRGCCSWEWPAIVHDLGLGHPLKFIWEEKG